MFLPIFPAFLFLRCSVPPRNLHSFPTRRSSDLTHTPFPPATAYVPPIQHRSPPDEACAATPDRKSTRLNSSHEWTSYAVFCLKKQKKPALYRAALGGHSRRRCRRPPRHRTRLRG